MKKPTRIPVLLLLLLAGMGFWGSSEIRAVAGAEEQQPRTESPLTSITTDPSEVENDVEIHTDPSPKQHGTRVSVGGQSKRDRRDILILSMSAPRGPCPRVGPQCRYGGCPTPNPCICDAASFQAPPRCMDW